MTHEEANWRKIAHDLAYMIHFLKDDPTSIKTWEKVFKHMEEYKKACEMEYPEVEKAVSKAEERRQQYFRALKEEQADLHKNKENRWKW